MSENTAKAACTQAEFDMARAAGLLVASTGDERAIHAFAEAVRASSYVPAGVRWFWKNSDESQYWRYTDPPVWKAKPEDLVVQNLFTRREP